MARQGPQQEPQQEPQQGPQQGPQQDTPQETLAYDDADVGDQDSTYESDLESTASLRSSILEHRTQYGRTYHSYNEGKYPFPNDAFETDRLDLQHHIFELQFDGRLGLCPMNDKTAKVDRVLDVGCGTGIWAIDYGDEHPEATVIGVDLSPIQPCFVPPNVDFQIDDLEEPWTFADEFDYIHCRIMTASIKNWEGFLQQCFDNLKPGGYLEVTDPKLPHESDDGTLLSTHSLRRWTEYLLEASHRMGRPFNDPSTYKSQMERIGFEEVMLTRYRWPINSWPKDPKYKELGMWNYENILDGAAAFSYVLFQDGLGWSKEEVDLLLVDVRKCLRDQSIHAYVPMYTVYGRKPAGK